MIVGIVGTGVMGRQVARYLAQKNVPVILCGRSAESIANAQRANRAELERASDRNRLSERGAVAIASSIVWTRHLDDLGGCDLVLECIVEDPTAKRQLIETLDSRMPSGAIIATNTSSIPVASLATAARLFPERVIGIHFVNPVDVFGSVEVISGRTAHEVVARVRAFLESVGKLPIDAPDSPGFIINRVLFAGIAAALELLEEGKTDAATIDLVMSTFHRGGKMGPLKLADFIGLDVVAGILEQMERARGEWRGRGYSCLDALVAAGKLGRKSGEGFFVYEDRT